VQQIAALVRLDGDGVAMRPSVRVERRSFDLGDPVQIPRNVLEVDDRETDAMIASRLGAFVADADAVAVGAVLAAIAGASSATTNADKSARSSARRGRAVGRISECRCIIYS